MTEQPGPGWYHGDGDPPDTQRYWNGSEWTSNALPIPEPFGKTDPTAPPAPTRPAPAASSEPTPPRDYPSAGEPYAPPGQQAAYPPPTGYPAQQAGYPPPGAYPGQPYAQPGAYPGQPYAPGYGQPAYPPATYYAPPRRPKELLASWGSRVASFLIDFSVFIPGVVLAGILDDGNSATDSPAEIVGGLLFLLAILVHFGNRIILQGQTGQSFGKRVMKIRNVRMDSDEHPGIGVMFGRAVLTGVLGLVSCNIYTLLDYISPTWDKDNQRFTDKIFTMQVIKA